MTQAECSVISFRMERAGLPDLRFPRPPRVGRDRVPLGATLTLSTPGSAEERELPLLHDGGDGGHGMTGVAARRVLDTGVPELTPG